jgi:hypothetical protein
MSKNKKVLREKRRCIFCNEPGDLTRQHIFSDFLGHYIERTKEGSTHLASDNWFGPSMSHSPNYTVKADQGDMGVKKLLLVCERCNSGWISKNEDQIKDTIGELIRGERVVIDEQMISKISMWVAIMVIMAEFMVAEERGIHRYHRNFIFKNRQPDRTFQIWIGKYDGKWPQLRRWAHLIYGDIPTDTESLDFSVIDHPNHCQATTIILGKLFIVAATNPSPDIEHTFTGALQQVKDHLIQLWPLEGAAKFSKSWPLLKATDDDIFDIISNFMSVIIEAAKKNADSFTIAGKIR